MQSTLKGTALKWTFLVIVTIGLVVLLKKTGVPAALLLGPLLAGISFALGGAGLKPAKPLMLGSYTLIGCAFAITLGGRMELALLLYLPLFLTMAGSTLLISAGLGWGLARRGWFPGATAVWGLSPGGAAGMVAMAHERGDDSRMVAVMQYLRILMVTGMAILLAHAQSGHAGPLSEAGWFPPLDLPGLGQTLILAAAGYMIAHRLNFPTAALLFPGLVGLGLIGAGLVQPSVPPVLVAAAYAFIGWNIGLSFTRETLMACGRAIPRVLLSAAILIGLCGGAGLLVSVLFDVDWLTGYLATTPGGIDAILIIGASVPVDLPFILSAQIVRVLLVLLLGPAIATFVARQVD